MSPIEGDDHPSEDAKEDLPSLAGIPAKSDLAASQLEEMLQTLWVNNRQTIDERMKSLRGTFAQADAGTLDNATRQLGAQAAHKLAGVLGTFGLPRGSDLGRSIEEMLEQAGKLTVADVSQLGQWIVELESVIASKTAKKA